MFEPRFTTHGFQYVRVEGHPGPLTADDVTGVVVHTDLRAARGLRVQRRRASTGCTRRRCGPSAATPATSRPTARPASARDGPATGSSTSRRRRTSTTSRASRVKWLRDLVVEQWDDGNLGNMAPMPVAERTGFLEKMNGSAGWGDAIVLVPWELYEEYGDTAALAEIWPAMVRWLDRVERMASRARGTPTRVERNAEPLPHEQYLWDTGFHWGEWLEPGGEPGGLPEVHRRRQVRRRDRVLRLVDRGTPRAIAAAAGRRRGGRALRRAAATRRRRLAHRVRRRRRPVTPHTQANLVRALRFGLVPDEHRQRAADDLAAAGARGRRPPATGFLATPDLLPVLADHGHLDLGLRAALPGLRALVADDDRPRRHDHVGALERHRRRRRARTSRSTTTPRAR